MSAGRKPQNVEFLNILYNLMEYDNVSDFAKDCGKAQPNMHNYLKGKVIPQKRVLVSCLKNLEARRLSRVCEISKIPTTQTAIPASPGIYIIFDSAGNALYIGQTNNFRKEVWQTLNRAIPISLRIGPKLQKVKPRIRELAAYYSLYEVEDSMLRQNLEALLLRTFANQTLNTNIGSFIE